jgi:hypothetical protein
MMIHPDDIQGADIVFLLSVNWMGMEYRFSTIPLDLKDNETGQVYRYNGGLSDPSIDQNTNFVGVNVDGDSVSVELVFHDIDWVQEWLLGRELTYSPCEMSMVPVRNGQTEYSYRDRIKLYTGKATDPILGTPDKPRGHIIFSIENNLNTVKSRLLQESFRIDPFQFPGLNQNLGALGRTIQYPIGKYVPLVFGKPGVWVGRKYLFGTLPFGGPGIATKNVEFRNTAGVSPAYAIDVTGSGVSQEVTYVIAQGEVASDEVRVWDETGGNFVNMWKQKPIRMGPGVCGEISIGVCN